MEVFKKDVSKTDQSNGRTWIAKEMYLITYEMLHVIYVCKLRSLHTK